MVNNWWWNMQWQVRDEGPLGWILSGNDTLSLEPNTTTGKPSFFWIRFNNKNAAHVPYWRDSYVYSVGVKPPTVDLRHSWDDSRDADGQAQVKAEYQTMCRQVRRSAADPYTARLEGHIHVSDHIEGADHIEIIRLVFFKEAQPNGNHWFVIDALQQNEVPKKLKRGDLNLLEDGTGHGDPK